MADHPYIARDWEVLAFLANRKTRISAPVRPQPPRSYDDGRILLLPFQYVGYDPDYPDAPEYHLWRTDTRHGHGLRHCVRCPFGVPGDRLWVRETWQLVWELKGKGGNLNVAGVPFRPMKLTEWRHGCDENNRVLWRADGAVTAKDGGGFHWRPPQHMPRWASRIILEVTDVKVERVQEISKTDVFAEGFTKRDGDALSDVMAGWHEPFAQQWHARWAKKGYPFEDNVWAWVGTVKRLDQQASKA